MMKLNLWFGALLLSLLAGTAFCAASGAGSSGSGAALQVTGHTTIPSAVYSGTAGQLQLAILNSGSDTAGAVKVSYRTPSQSDYSDVYIGDIGAGSSATASIPFTVPSKTGTGFFIIDVNVVYFGDQAHSSIKNTLATIPIIVNQYQILSVKTVSVEPQSIQPGDSVTAQLEITNTGGVMNGVVVSTPDTSSLSVEGGTQLPVGDIQSNSTTDISLKLVSSSSTATGKYTVPITVSYRDGLQNTINQTVYIGPITVADASTQFEVSLTPLTGTEAGSESQFALCLKNIGGSTASAIVDLSLSDEATPIGPTRLFFDDIAPSQNQTKTITIGISGTALAGYYNFPITITGNGKSYTQNIGIVVNATPDLIVSSSTQPQYISGGSNGVKVVAQIANVGNGPIRSVYVSAKPAKNITIAGATDKFIGTLNVDDFASFQFTINVPSRLPPGEYRLPLTISFKDSKNEEHVLNEYVAITVYSAQDSARLGALDSTGSSSGAAGRNSGGLPLPLPVLVGAPVVLVLGFFAYKKFKGAKK